MARHLAAPQQPLYRELPDRVTAWSRLPAIRAAAAASIFTRPVMLIVGYLAVFMFGYANGRAPLRHFNDELLNLPVRWDAGWYLQIVTDGYLEKYVTMPTGGQCRVAGMALAMANAKGAKLPALALFSQLYLNGPINADLAR